METQRALRLSHKKLLPNWRAETLVIVKRETDRKNFPQSAIDIAASVDPRLSAARISAIFAYHFIWIDQFVTDGIYSMTHVRTAIGSTLSVCFSDCVGCGLTLQEVHYKNGVHRSRNEWEKASHYFVGGLNPSDWKIFLFTSPTNPSVHMNMFASNKKPSCSFRLICGAICSSPA